jgi:hypothetical protein
MICFAYLADSNPFKRSCIHDKVPGEESRYLRTRCSNRRLSSVNPRNLDLIMEVAADCGHSYSEKEWDYCGHNLGINDDQSQLRIRNLSINSFARRTSYGQAYVLSGKLFCGSRFFGAYRPRERLDALFKLRRYSESHLVSWYCRVTCKVTNRSTRATGRSSVRCA